MGTGRVSIMSTNELRCTVGPHREYGWMVKAAKHPQRLYGRPSGVSDPDPSRKSGLTPRSSRRFINLIPIKPL